MGNVRITSPARAFCRGRDPSGCYNSGNGLLLPDCDRACNGAASSRCISINGSDTSHKTVTGLIRALAPCEKKTNDAVSRKPRVTLRASPEAIEGGAAIRGAAIRGAAIRGAAIRGASLQGDSASFYGGVFTACPENLHSVWHRSARGSKSLFA